MTLRAEPDAQTMRHVLTLLCGSLRSLASRLENDDEELAKEVRELGSLAADAAGLQFESDAAKTK